jgi:uncharacterized protein YpuA (DUF1002 family)
MAKHTTTAWATFPTREDAQQAIQRLSSAGFARNSIDLDRRQDGSWEVTVHTSPRNTERVNQLLRAPSPMYAVQRRSSGAVESLIGNPLVLAGAAALAGTIIYSLLPSNRASVVQSVRRFPSRVRETVEELPETVRDAASAVTNSVADLPETVRAAVGSMATDQTQRS